MSHTADSDQAARKLPAWIKPVLLLSVAAAVMVGAYLLDVGQYIRSLQDWIKGYGAWGPAIFAAIYGVATVLALPGTALTAVAGGLFGSVLGVVAVSVGSTLGAGLAFLVARYLARGAVVKWLEGNEKFQRLDRLTERQGAIMVAITRLVPLFPFNLLNFGFGLTRVPFWTYLLFSWLCMLPGTILYVVGFDALFTALAEGKVPWLLISVVAVMALILALLIKQARGRLKEDPKEVSQSIETESS